MSIHITQAHIHTYITRVEIQTVQQRMTDKQSDLE